MVRNCKFCGKEFEQAHFNQKYCSDSCRRESRRARSREWNMAHKEELRKRRMELPREVRTCLICGKAFEVGRGRGYKYCSDGCRREAHRRSVAKRQRMVRKGVAAPRMNCANKHDCLNCPCPRCVYD